MPDQADLVREAEAVLRKYSGAGMINVEVTDKTGARRVLMVRFPRALVAIWTCVAIVIVFGLPWLIVPFMNNTSGAPDWAMSLFIVLILALLFGWILVLSLITAVRGGFFGLTPTGVLIDTGLSSVHIPWTAISGTSAETFWMYKGNGRSYPGLRLSIRGDYRYRVPWFAALSPVLLGSSRRKLRIVAWWFQPVPLDWMVTIVRYLASHPEERPRIGRADPDEWLQASLAAGQGDV